MSRTVALLSLAACLLSMLPVACRAAAYQYWQITVDANGAVSAPVRLPPVEAAAPPSQATPIAVTPKPSETAVEYRILRVPTHAPAAPTVEVVNKGNDTVYYWLVAHVALLRSPMAGPAVVADCDLNNLKNIVRWPKTEPYADYTVLRTATPEPPAGELQVLRLWGRPVTEFTDSNGTRLSHDYPCYPQGTVVGASPIGNGPYLVGVSRGPMAKAPGDTAAVNAPVQDTGALKIIDVAPARIVSNVQLSPSLDKATMNAQNSGNDGALQINITNTQPKGKYDFGGPIGFFVNQRDVAGGHNDYGLFGASPLQKSFHIPFRVDQYNYTAGQMATMVMFTGKYGEGDNVLFTTHTTSEGLTEDGGDEGTEIFMASANLKRVAGDYEMEADAAKHSTRLRAKALTNVNVATGRPVVNLTQAVSTGAIVRVDDDMPVDPKLPENVAANRVTRLAGEGTAFTKAMEGWYISLDCDTTSSGLRQWYRVTRVNSPTSLDIYAYTFFSASTYLGHAANVIHHGEKYRGGIKTEPRPTPDPKSAKDGRERYLLAPASTIAEYPGTGQGNLTVMPLKQPWNKGDRIQVVAGPQTNLSLGKFGIGGNLLPQDFAYGFWIHNDTDRLSNDPAFYIMGPWRSAVKMELDSRGLSNGMEFLGKANPDGGIFVCSPDTNLLRVTGVPVVLGSSSQSGELIFAKGRHDGEKVVGISAGQLALGEQVSLKGGGMLRGRMTFSGDGKATAFTVKFPRAHPAAPYVVAGSNLPLGIGVTQVTPDGFTVTFAAAPPAGKDNVEVTWMVIE